jgi:hypothetical protein
MMKQEEISENFLHSARPMTKQDEIRALILSIDIDVLVKEREFMENLFVGRFNYFIVVFSLFMTAGFANAITPDNKDLVFYAGALALFLVWLPLFRGYKKHDRIMRLIFRDRRDHPAHAIERIMQLEGYVSRYRVSLLMGVMIPWVCITILFAFAVAISHRLL